MTSLKKIVVIGLALFSFHAVAELPAPSCPQLIDSKSYKEAFSVCYDAAYKGDAEGAFYVGAMHINGWGVKPDQLQGFNWVEKGAYGSYPHAAMALSTLYLNGIGTEKDLDKSRFWSKRYIDTTKSDPLYREGLKQLAEGNRDGAITSFFGAIELKHSGAMYSMANIYLESGQFKKGIKLLERSGEERNAQAFDKLSNIYSEGVFALKDIVKAKNYLIKAMELM